MNYLKYDTPFDLYYYVDNSNEQTKEYIKELKRKHNENKKMLEDIYNEIYGENFIYGTKGIETLAIIRELNIKKGVK